MIAVRLLLTALAACLFLSGGQKPAGAQSASSWVTEGASRLRLVAGPAAADRSLRAGLEIRLEEGWKTYWLNPGPTGLPPRLDFSGSGNLAKAEPLWPAPVRFEDGNADAAGYTGLVVVPLRIEPKDPEKPITLKAVLDYGMCEKICVPARAEVSLTLDPRQRLDAMAAAQIAGFEARVPKPARLGEEAPLAISGVARNADGIAVSVRFPPDAKPADLFARADGVSLAVPRKGDEPGAFFIKLKPGAAPKTVHLVAVAGAKAIEVPVSLDGLPPTP